MVSIAHSETHMQRQPAPRIVGTAESLCEFTSAKVKASAASSAPLGFIALSLVGNTLHTFFPSLGTRL
ncbi:WD repeat domain 27 (predicted), partial [Rattus norvegicus]